MSEGHVKVSYLSNNAKLILVVIIFLIALDVLIIFISPGTLFSTIYTAFVIILSIYLLYLTLNRIKEISFYNNKIYINRFFLKSFTYEVEDIKSISVEDFKIGRKKFNLRFVTNNYEVISLLLNALKNENVDETTNQILNGTVIYLTQEEIRTNYIIAIIFKIIFVLAIIVIVVLKNLPILFIVCGLIFWGLFYLYEMLFEERLNKINSTFIRNILKGFFLLIGLAVTIVFGIVIHKVFKFYNIDLLEMGMKELLFLLIGKKN